MTEDFDSLFRLLFPQCAQKLAELQEVRLCTHLSLHTGKHFALKKRCSSMYGTGYYSIENHTRTYFCSQVKRHNGGKLE